VDVLLWSANQPVSAATRKALLAYANRGGAIVAHHPGTWYAWKNFREWNLQVVGGGTRGHDALGAYTVKITNATHPITKAVHASFEIADELYNYNADPAGNAIEVLAEATSPKTGKFFSEGLHRQASEGPHRRPHARPRCTGARSPRIPDVAEERRPAGCGKVAAPSGARPRGNRTQENPLSPAFRVHISAPAPGEQQRRPENADERKIRTGIKTPPLANFSQHPQRARPTE
jgi:hypothetical protein